MKNEKYSKMLIPSILSVSLLTIMAPTAISPALAAIKDAFPGISATQAKLVLTLPTLVMMPMGLLSARLTTRFDKKKLLLIGMALFLVFGVAGGFVSNFKLLLLMRVLFGLGLGIMTPLSTSLIFDFAPDTNKRSKLLGIQGASNQLGGLVFMSLSGILASISWRYSFLTYAFVIVSMILTFLFMPSIPPYKADEKSVGNMKNKKMSKKILVLAFFAMMIFACYFVINTDLALFMDVERIGDAKECGYALSLMRIPAIIAGIMLAWIMRNLKDWTMPFATLIMASGYLIIAYSHSYDILMIGCLIVGLGGGFALPPISLYLPRIVTPRQRTLGVAIIMSVAQLGQFISPYYINIFVNGSTGDELRMRYVVSAITTVIIGFSVLVFTYTLPKKPLEN
ncbi:MAG: MFS transporter [Candidatus Phocaeicola faecigallinarum]|uniref:MFS transporter n=1 Tax=Candidatus Phocaeicola faecigallinarum TaxID=2838732 RepID=A0A948WVX6_9BACT|nr:MFS transporter [Candidatus Phocaeicola faecigallinarum]